MNSQEIIKAGSRAVAIDDVCSAGMRDGRVPGEVYDYLNELRMSSGGDWVLLSIGQNVCAGEVAQSLCQTLIPEIMKNIRLINTSEITEVFSAAIALVEAVVRARLIATEL